MYLGLTKRPFWGYVLFCLALIKQILGYGLNNIHISDYICISCHCMHCLTDVFFAVIGRVMNSYRNNEVLLCWSKFLVLRF